MRNTKLRKAVYVGPNKAWRGQTFLVKTVYLLCVLSEYEKEFTKPRVKYLKVVNYQADSFSHPLSHGWHFVPRHHMRIAKLDTEILPKYFRLRLRAADMNPKTFRDLYSQNPVPTEETVRDYTDDCVDSVVYSITGRFSHEKSNAEEVTRSRVCRKPEFPLYED